MTYIEAALLTALAALGGLCSWTDFRTGRVPNRYLLWALGAGLALHGAMLALGGAAYYPSWLANMAVADALAMLMYFGRIWAAGDAKLFMLLYFLTPPRLLDAGTLSHAVTPYLFIFLPAFGWALVDSVIRWLKREPRRAAQPFQWRRQLTGMAAVMVQSTAFYCAAVLLARPFVEENELLMAVMMLVYAVFCGTQSWMNRWYVWALHIGVIALAAALGEWRLSLPDGRTYLLILAGALLQRFTQLYNYQQIPTASVRAGMILSAENVLRFTASRVRGLPADASEELPAAITADEADAVRRWERSAKGEPTVWIVRKVAFAIMIFAGFIGWLVYRIVG